MSTATLNRMSHWREAVIGDVLARIESGVSPKAMDRPTGPDEYGVLKVSAVTWGEFRPEENKALFPEFDTSEIRVVNAGDLLLSRANTAELLASPVLVPRDYHNLILSDKTLRLVPRRDVADARFLLYALRQPQARQYFLSHATGTSGSMRNVSQETIRNCPIPLPPLPEQKRIAAILDKADAIRRKRQEAIGLTEQLLRSAFLDMFGDPVANPMQWAVKKLQDISTRIMSGATPKGGKHVYPEEGITFFRSQNVWRNRIARVALSICLEPLRPTRNILHTENGTVINMFLFVLRRAGLAGRRSGAPTELEQNRWFGFDNLGNLVEFGRSFSGRLEPRSIEYFVDVCLRWMTDPELWKYAVTL